MTTPRDNLRYFRSARAMSVPPRAAILPLTVSVTPLPSVNRVSMSLRLPPVASFSSKTTTTMGSLTPSIKLQTP
jgi:hypothetical protein